MMYWWSFLWGFVAGIWASVLCLWLIQAANNVSKNLDGEP